MNRFRVDGKIISGGQTEMLNKLENRVVETWLYEIETNEHDVWRVLAPAGILIGLFMTIEGTLIRDGDYWVLHSDSLSWYRSVNKIGGER